MKKWMKAVAVMLCVALLAAVLAGCGNTAQQESGEATKKVALVLASTLGDKGFNDLTYEGLLRAQEDFGVEVKVLEAKTPADIEPNLLAMIDAKYDLIICLGAQVKEVLAQNIENYPDQKFGLIDGTLDEPNVVSYMPLQNEASFLAGAMAAKLTTDTDIPGMNEEKVIGWVGAMETPVLRDFLVGYIQGAQYVDPDIQVLTAYAGSFNDPLKGKELAFAQYSQGADIVMHVAGPTGDGVFEAANEQEKYAIGVNVNQDDIYPGRIITSVMKNTDIAAYDMVENLVNDTFESGIQFMGLENGGVSLTDFATIKEAWGDKFPEDLEEYLADLQEKILSGEIVVESEPGYGRNAGNA